MAPLYYQFHAICFDQGLWEASVFSSSGTEAAIAALKAAHCSLQVSIAVMGAPSWLQLRQRQD